MQVAVDVGGTFTDLLALDETTGRLLSAKVPSVPSNPEKGFHDSLLRLEEQGADLHSIGRIVHGGTIGTNLLLGQVGLRRSLCALLTTEGFRDIIEIGRQNRPELYNVFFERPKPMVGRDLRFEVRERTDCEGRVMRKPSRRDLSRLGARMKKMGVETVAVCFLNSFANGSNEALAKSVLEGMGFEVHASHLVDPQHREFERTSTTVVNAVMAPVVSGYLGRLRRILKDEGVRCGMQLLSSSGGLVDEEEVAARPIAAIESGPAAGVIGASMVARRFSLRKVVSFDMGGTTAKAGAVVDFEPLTVREIEVGGKTHMGRSVKGSGYPVRYPSVDLAEVSAGGGTLLWADRSNSLRTGPLSAGADPGPVCYGKGGKEPTVTDANLHLGRLRSMLGGELKLDARAASSTIGRLGGKVGEGSDGTAAAALNLVNSQMSRAINIVSLERGMDPREFVMIAFGGAGPMHAAELAEMVGIGRVIVPPRPGLFSAAGMLSTDMRYSAVKGYLARLDEVDPGEVEETFLGMESDLRSRLQGRGLDTTRAGVAMSADARYERQGYEIEVPVSGMLAISKLRTRFEEKHSEVYGFSHGDVKVELVALRVQLTIPSKHFDVLSGGIESRQGRTQTGKAWFSGGWRQVGVYDRGAVSEEMEGPLIIEEYDSTTVVPPGWTVSTIGGRCLQLEMSG